LYIRRFGIDLVPEARGCGNGTEPRRPLESHRFETRTVHRVEQWVLE
jgi:hypothetical protein